MPYLLRFDGVNDVVTIPNGMSGNIGTSAYSFRVKSGPDGITLPATLNRGFIGASLASASGLVVTSGGLIEVWRVGTKLYGSTAQRLFTGVPFDFTMSHLADGTWTITDNLTSTVTDSGTYTNNITWSGSGVLNQLGKNSSNANNSCLAGDIALIAVTGLLNADTWDADLSGGSGSILPSTSGTNNGTLVNFSVPSCWIFYSSGGTSWEGTVGKTSISLVTKALSINTGQVLSQDKTTLTLSTKQQSISTGFVATNGKTSLTLSPKQEAINVGYINTLSKLGLALLQKQLSITVGSDLPFTGVIGKTTYALNGKQLGLALGWNSGVVKSILPVSNKQESVLAGFVNTINEINIPVNGKPLNLQTGTSISYVGTINKGSLNASGKPLNVVVGTSIPFVGLMQKTSLTLTGKQLGVVRGQVLDLQKQALNIVGKQLSLGEIVYPIVPIERIFTIKDGDRIHYFKQTTTVYVMKNN